MMWINGFDDDCVVIFGSNGGAKAIGCLGAWVLIDGWHGILLSRLMARGD